MGKKKHASQPAVTPQAMAASLGLPLAGADSHAHLDLRHFGEDLEIVLKNAHDAGVATIGNVFLSVAAWESNRKLFDNHKGVFFILGIHPTDSTEYSTEIRQKFTEAFISDKRLRAVGEIGLDYYWKECPPDRQKTAFIDQLRLAKELHLPVVIHSRDAYEDTVKILKDEGFHGYPLLWHCFGGTREQAMYLVDAGWHISIPGPVTFPSNSALRDALAVIPHDRLLVETDCPYLAPMPYRGKRNEPAYTVFTAAKIAETLGIEPRDLWRQCGDNARAFFGLPAGQDGAKALLTGTRS